MSFLTRSNTTERDFAYLTSSWNPRNGTPERTTVRTHDAKWLNDAGAARLITGSPCFESFPSFDRPSYAYASDDDMQLGDDETLSLTIDEFDTLYARLREAHRGVDLLALDKRILTQMLREEMYELRANASMSSFASAQADCDGKTDWDMQIDSRPMSSACVSDHQQGNEHYQAQDYRMRVSYICEQSGSRITFTNPFKQGEVIYASQDNFNAADDVDISPQEPWCPLRAWYEETNGPVAYLDA